MQDSEEEYRRKVESYGDAELQDILSSVDRENYPGRRAIVEAEIARRLTDPQRVVRKIEENAPASKPDAPSGFGGWLILPLIGVVAAPIAWAVLFVLYVRLGFNSQVGAVFGDPSSPHHFPGWSWFVASTATVGLGMSAFSVWVLVEFLRKTRRAPRLVILSMGLAAAYMIGFHLFFTQAPPILADVAHKMFRMHVQTLIMSCVWILYFLKSKRVANTFVN